MKSCRDFIALKQVENYASSEGDILEMAHGE